jgi:hypothetical protein
MATVMVHIREKIPLVATSKGFVPFLLVVGARMKELLGQTVSFQVLSNPRGSSRVVTGSRIGTHPVQMRFNINRLKLLTRI